MNYLRHNDNLFVYGDKTTPMAYSEVMKTTETIVPQLIKAGLSDKAALVYATLLAEGGCYPSAIAEATHLNRSTVYKILLDLSVKGLITEILKGKKLFYQIEKPQKLLRYAKSRLDQAEDVYETTKRLLPEVEGLYSLLPEKPIVKFFSGVEGVLTAYEDHVLQTKPYEMVGWVNEDKLHAFMPAKFFQDYRRRKEKIGVTTRGILPDRERDKDLLAAGYKGIAKKYMPIVRYVPAETFHYASEITVYGENKVSIFNMKADKLIGVIIEDDTIHHMMRMIFELSWKGAAA